MAAVGLLAHYGLAMASGCRTWQGSQKVLDLLPDDQDRRGPGGIGPSSLLLGAVVWDSEEDGQMVTS